MVSRQFTASGRGRKQGFVNQVWALSFMRFLCIIVLLLACNTPYFEFSGVPAQRVIVGKSVFDVRMVGDQAEAIGSLKAARSIAVSLTPPWGL